MIEIKIELDIVTIEGVVVKRPQRIARSVWVDFWENAIYERTDAVSHMWGE
jgi:hypothetical protein